ncbi:MAG: hypothetical protein RR640_03085, partial [Oscillospiraceae bacterium]
MKNINFKRLTMFLIVLIPPLGLILTGVFFTKKMINRILLIALSLILTCFLFLSVVKGANNSFEKNILNEKINFINFEKDFFEDDYILYAQNSSVFHNTISCSVLNKSNEIK